MKGVDSELHHLPGVSCGEADICSPRIYQDPRTKGKKGSSLHYDVCDKKEEIQSVTIVIYFWYSSTETGGQPISRPTKWHKQAYIDAENQGWKILWSCISVNNDTKYFDLIAQKLILKKVFGLFIFYDVILLTFLVL